MSGAISFLCSLRDLTTVECNSSEKEHPELTQYTLETACKLDLCRSLINFKSLCIDLCPVYPLWSIFSGTPAVNKAEAPVARRLWFDRFIEYTNQPSLCSSMCWLEYILRIQMTFPPVAHGSSKALEVYERPTQSQLQAVSSVMSQPGCSFSEELHSRSEVYEHKKEMTTSGAGLLGSMFSGLNECSIQIAPQSMVVNIMQSPQSQSTGKWLSLWTLGSITWTPVVLVHYCDNYLLWLIPTSKKNLKGYIKAWALAAEYLPVGYHSCQMLLFTWSILYHVNFWGAAIASLQIGLFLRTK